ncbi:MAG: HdeD family acid-resistance protein [Acidiferrobacterales bacterium]
MNDSVVVDGRRLMMLGVALLVLGAIALLAPVFAGSAVVIIIGVVLLVAGIGQFVQGMRAESWRSKVMPLILGVITGLCGILVIGHPLLGLGFLTLLLVAFFVVEGVWKVVSSFSYRPASGWVWMLVSGVVSLLLGLLIWNQWPVSGMWAVGVLVGVDLLSTGMSMVVLASALRRVAQRA